MEWAGERVALGVRLRQLIVISNFRGYAMPRVALLQRKKLPFYTYLDSYSADGVAPCVSLAPRCHQERLANRRHLPRARAAMRHRWEIKPMHS